VTLSLINQGPESLDSATDFAHHIDATYNPLFFRLMATSTQDRYEGALKNCLLPAFGRKCLRVLTPMSLQAYFLGNGALAACARVEGQNPRYALEHLQTAVTYGLLVKNPTENVHLPPEKRGKRRNKQYLTAVQDPTG
jgi:hypothetical protein